MKNKKLTKSQRDKIDQLCEKEQAYQETILLLSRAASNVNKEIFKALKEINPDVKGYNFETGVMSNYRIDKP